jgi:hypothetical protein
MDRRVFNGGRIVSQHPTWTAQAGYVPSSSMLLRRIFKVFLYFVGIFLSGFGFLGATLTFPGSSNRVGYIALVIGIIAFIGSLIYFFLKRFKAPCLPWLHYLWWILGATIGSIVLIVLEIAFVPNPNDKQLPTAIFGCIILLYGVALTGIAHLKPSLHQQINESVRDILKTMPGTQLALTELIARLHKEYGLPDAKLYQQIESLQYIEQIDMPGTNIRVCRIRGTKIILDFPQVAQIATFDLRQKVARALLFLNEENVDIGLFLLSKEFEATLKAYIQAAHAKGKLQIPIKGPPERWKLEQMIEWVRKSGIIVDSAVLNYLRQTRNDRAHGTMPSPAERQALMMGVQYLADLYIDYINLLDDLTHNL